MGLATACAPASRTRKPDEPGILVLGHLDTVHPVGTLAKLPWRREGNECFGPGIFDMKGGNFSRWRRSAQLARAGIHDAAAGHRAVHRRRGGRQPLDPRPDRGRGRAPHNTCWCPSRAARATASSPAATPSRASTSRRPAARAMPARRCRRAAPRSARWPGKILAIDGMTTDDCTFSVGIVHGGQWVNCVADHLHAARR